MLLQLMQLQVCSNRTFMELKYKLFGFLHIGAHRSNRTFMELKYILRAWAFW